MALRPDARAGQGFRFIASVHSGEERSQLLVGQWKKTIIVMNGADYDNSQRAPRLTADISRYEGAPFLLVVRSGQGSSDMYIDGMLATRRDITLRLPTDIAAGRLILGNSAYGTGAWSGDIVGFALHRVVLDGETLQRHQASWHRDLSFAGFDYSSAHLSYPLTEGIGRIALDRSSSGMDLLFPSDKTFITPKVFDIRVDGTVLRGPMLWDVAINRLYPSFPNGVST